jgi:ribokinase
MDVIAGTERFPAAGETVMGSAVSLLPGGKGANQAVAAALAGGDVSFVGCVGDDDFGTTMLEFLAGHGVDVDLVGRVREPTGVAVIVVDAQGQNRIVVVPGANALVAPAMTRMLRPRTGDVLLAQLEVPVATVESFMADKGDALLTILNAAPMTDLDRSLLERVDVLVVNEVELAALTGGDVPTDDIRAIEDAARRARARQDQVVVVTIGAHGVVVLDGDSAHHVAGHAVGVIDTTGAGDCFVGYLATCASNGDSMTAASEIANAAAALSTTRAGAAPSIPTLEEVRAFLSRQPRAHGSRGS